MSFEPVIGLEIHAQLLTETKIFCGCSTAIRRAAQHARLPGVPRPAGRAAGAEPARRRVRRRARRTRSAARCSATSIFARKNYFYPDLPKGYQISQYERPLATAGARRTTRAAARPARVGITRVHLEEDAGKSLHEGFRRFGPLHLPRFQSQRRAAHRDRHRAGSAIGRRRERLLQPAARDPRGHRRERREHGGGQPALRRERLGASGGHARRFGIKAEVKNLNSFRHVQRALEYEIARQTALARAKAGASCRRRACGIRPPAAPSRCAARRRRTTIATSRSRTCRRWQLDPAWIERCAATLPGAAGRPAAPLRRAVRAARLRRRRADAVGRRRGLLRSGGGGCGQRQGREQLGHGRPDAKGQRGRRQPHRACR